MFEDGSKGARTSGVGNVEGSEGGASSDLGLRVEDAGAQLASKIQETTGKVQSAICEAADKATTTVSKITDQVSAGIGRASDQAEDVVDRSSVGARMVAETVDPFVQGRPYAAIGIAAAIGVVIGLLMSRTSPKVIYVKRGQ